MRWDSCSLHFRRLWFRWHRRNKRQRKSVSARDNIGRQGAYLYAGTSHPDGAATQPHASERRARDQTHPRRDYPGPCAGAAADQCERQFSMDRSAPYRRSNPWKHHDYNERIFNGRIRRISDGRIAIPSQGFPGAVGRADGDTRRHKCRGERYLLRDQRYGDATHF